MLEKNDGGELGRDDEVGHLRRSRCRSVGACAGARCLRDAGAAAACALPARAAAMCCQ
jgi:hypothetical protein